MRTITRAAAAVLTTTLALGAGVAPALADTATVKDKASDVIRFANLDDDRGTILGYSESVASGLDLRSMRVKHTKKSVAVKLRFSRLNNQATAFVYFKLPGESVPTRFLLTVSKKEGQLVSFENNKKGCTVPLTTRTGTNGYINAVVKRSCLDNPKRVKVAAGTVSAGLLADDEDSPYLTDSVSPTSYRGISFTRWLSAG